MMYAVAYTINKDAVVLPCPTRAEALRCASKVLSLGQCAVTVRRLTTSEIIDALMTVYPDSAALNRACAEIWQDTQGTRHMLKVDALHLLYNQHFNQK